MYNQNPLDGFAPHFHFQNRAVSTSIYVMISFGYESGAQRHLADYHCTFCFISVCII